MPERSRFGAGSDFAPLTGSFTGVPQPSRRFSSQFGGRVSLRGSGDCPFAESCERTTGASSNPAATMVSGKKRLSIMAAPLFVGLVRFAGVVLRQEAAGQALTAGRFHVNDAADGLAVLHRDHADVDRVAGLERALEPAHVRHRG